MGQGMKIIRRLGAWLLHRVWYTHPRRVLLVHATPVECLYTLALAAKPSTQRLHLRNLFMDGRRYYLKPNPTGFRLNSTSRPLWRRGRGRIASVLLGVCKPVDDRITRVDLRAHLTPLFLLDVFVLPAWMSLLLIAGPLPRSAGIGASLLILALSWIWHWYTAALQATEMVYFVQVALNDLPEAQVAELSANNEFAVEWEKFYEQHRTDGG
jgi:hypothetical protein